jgi:hypothetical protein
MKKTFTLEHPKINVARRVEAIKHEIKKYQTRERKKALPADADFWDFECKFGETEVDAGDIHVSEINKHIDAIESKGLLSFYLEVISTPKQRIARSVVAEDDETEALD